MLLHLRLIVMLLVWLLPLLAGCGLDGAGGIRPPQSIPCVRASDLCELTSQCVRSQVCYRGYCSDVSCREPTDCRRGEQCLHMVCHPPCGSDHDCHFDERCVEGVCTPTGLDCPVPPRCR